MTLSNERFDVIIVSEPERLQVYAEVWIDDAYCLHIEKQLQDYLVTMQPTHDGRSWSICLSDLRQAIDLGVAELEQE